MSKINLKFNEKNYELEYSRQSVRAMESQGFVLEKISEMPMTMIPLLFSGAFMMHCKGIKRSLIDEIYESVADKSGLVFALAELYAETVSTLMDDGDEGNASWAKVE